MRIISTIAIIITLTMSCNNRTLDRSVKEGKYFRYKEVPNQNETKNASLDNRSNKNIDPGPIQSNISKEDSILADDKIRIVYQNEFNEKIETILCENDLSESEKKFFNSELIMKKNLSKRLVRQNGEINERLHWDIDFRKKNSDKIKTISKQKEEKKLVLKKGSLTKKDWLEIDNIDLIQNIDPSFLSEEETWPKRYIKLLKYNKCRRSGLLQVSRAMGCGVLMIWLGLEIFFILKTIADEYYIMASAIWGINGFVLCSIITNFLFDPYHVKTEKLFCKQIEEYQTIIKEPSKFHKTICCMRKLKSKIPGSYRCFGCFRYPNCCDYLGITLRKISTRVSDFCLKYICCINTQPQEMEIVIGENYHGTPQGIELRINEN